MKKLQLILTGAIVATMLLALAGCGSAAEEAAPEEPAEDAEEVILEEYKSDDGWSVKYDPNLVEVQGGGGAVDFLYTGGPDESSDADLVTISCEQDKMPEEVLGEITADWGDDADIQRSEGYFPGTDDQWGFWRTMDAPEDGSGPARTAIAAEYNGGTLLIQYAAYITGDDEADMAAGGAMETIVDSLAYEDFQPQTMFEYVPGTYTAEQDGAVYTVTLKEDHTGVLSFQDDVNITWSSIELTADDGSFTYQYTVEGDNIYIEYDGDWMEFARE